MQVKHPKPAGAPSLMNNASPFQREGQEPAGLCLLLNPPGYVPLHYMEWVFQLLTSFTRDK